MGVNSNLCRDKRCKTTLVMVGQFENDFGLWWCRGGIVSKSPTRLKCKKMCDLVEGVCVCVYVCGWIGLIWN